MEVAAAENSFRSAQVDLDDDGYVSVLEDVNIVHHHEGNCLQMEQNSSCLFIEFDMIQKPCNASCAKSLFKISDNSRFK